LANASRFVSTSRLAKGAKGAFDLTDEITVHLYHLPELFLGQVAVRADGTEAYAER